jgi:hypothetical protein
MEGTDHDRFAITIISRRKRRLDADNPSLKFCIDALRFAGIIPDDDDRYVSSLTIRQEIIGKNEKPETIIVVERWNKLKS